MVAPGPQAAWSPQRHEEQGPGAVASARSPRASAHRRRPCGATGEAGARPVTGQSPACAEPLPGVTPVWSNGMHWGDPRSYPKEQREALTSPGTPDVTHPSGGDTQTPSGGNSGRIWLEELPLQHHERSLLRGAGRPDTHSIPPTPHRAVGQHASSPASAAPRRCPLSAVLQLSWGLCPAA